MEKYGICQNNLYNQTQKITFSTGKEKQDKIWVLFTVAGKSSFSDKVFTALIGG
jgi:hypothetical protein